ncbi:MAG: tRNA (adenosine(37)-N6)-dimethylallyltransferase MiaA [Chakrabartia sp.]
MESSDKPIPVALIAGPTASGKSAVALDLAQRIPATIINADASQVYRDLRILSARPSEAEEAAAPHRLFGYIDGAESCSAARWAKDAQKAIEESSATGRLPILVGGTGLYLRTLLDGIAPVPEIDPDIRAMVRAMDIADAYQALTREDPGAAARLAANDRTRVARALEVVRATGRPLAQWQADRVGGLGHRLRLAAMVLLPPRPWLYARCDHRFGQMLTGGAIAEVEALLARGLSADLPVLRAIGVPEIAGMIQGALSRDAALAQGQQATRNYAKRQFTWFRNQPPADWQRIEQELDNKVISDLAIKLRDLALT